MDQGRAGVQQLPSQKLRSNWLLKRLKPRSFLVPDLGGQIEEVASAIATTVDQRSTARCKLALAGEETQVPGERRALRAIYTLQAGHVAAADVVLKSHQGDLYVELKHVARTRLGLLRLAVAVLIVLSICGTGVVAYTKLAPGAMKSWVLDFASRHAAKYDQAGYLSATGDVDRFAATELMEGSAAVDVEQMQALFTQSLTKNQAARIAKLTGNDWLGLSSKFWEMQFSQIILNQFSDAVAGSNAGYGDYILFTYPKYGAAQNGFSQHLVARIRMTPKTYEMLLNGVSRGFAESFGEEVARTARLALKQSTVQVTPKSLVHVFMEDPRLGLMHVGAPVGALTAIVGLVFMMLPPWFLRYPARILGMPSPEEYESTVHAHMAWLERVVGDAFQSMGVDTGSVRSMDWS